MNKEKVLKFIEEIKEIIETHQTMPCLWTDDEEDCKTCEDVTSNNGETCMLKGFFEIRNRCEEIEKDLNNN